jgi:hypothetical protein
MAAMFAQRAPGPSIVAHARPRASAATMLNSSGPAAAARRRSALAPARFEANQRTSGHDVLSEVGQPQLGREP